MEWALRIQSFSSRSMPVSHSPWRKEIDTDIAQLWDIPLIKRRRQFVSILILNSSLECKGENHNVTLISSFIND